MQVYYRYAEMTVNLKSDLSNILNKIKVTNKYKRIRSTSVIRLKKKKNVILMV